MKIKFIISLLCLILISTFNFCIVNAESYLTEDDIGFSEQDRMFNEEYEYLVNNQGEKYLCRVRLDYNGKEIANRQAEQVYWLMNTEKIFSVINVKNNFNKIDIYFQFDFVKFNELNNEDAEKILKNLRATDFYNNLSNKDKNRVLKIVEVNSNLTESLLIDNIFGDIKPDLVGGYKLYKPFEGYVGTSFAIIAILIMLLMCITIIIDMAYIFVFNTVNVPKFVSSAARKTVKEVNSGDKTSTQMIIFYIKERFIAFSILTIALMYLVAGRLFSIIFWFISLFE